MPKAILWVHVLDGFEDSMTSYRLSHTLEASGDPNNPGPDEMLRIIEDTVTIAVVGLSRDPVKAARRVPSYMAAKGYDVIPVNPFAERILGKPARASLDAVTESVDLVLVFRPSDEAGDVIRQAARRPERPVIWLQEGIRNDEAAQEARAAGLTVVQDLCIYKVHRALAGPHALAGSA
jgi:predicted CoA-binding protein